MTAIAWDGITLAADKLLGDEWTRRSTTKIRRVRGGEGLAGTSGDADRGRALLAWIDAGGEFPQHLQTCAESPATVLVVWRDGSVHLYQREPFPIVLDPGPTAIGGGADAAMAAMLCGKTAAEAVEIASRVCRGVGNGIDELRFAP